jgi:release factor glutamine methyltransferase
LSAKELAAYRSLVRRRAQLEPVAYIVGQKEFYGLTFEVSPQVLIPRPDTEHLVELALMRLPLERDVRLADVCTGSACVAVAIAKNRPRAEVWATEIDPGAAQIAKKNIQRHDLAERVHLIEGNLFEPCVGQGFFDMVVGNPPYVLAEDMRTLSDDVKRYEPTLALVGIGNDGLDCHRRILAQATADLKEGSYVLLEIGYDQAAAIRDIEVSGWSLEKVHADLSGHPRVAEWVRVA